MDKAHLRVARPTDDLDALVRFYRDGLGFEVLYSFHDHDGFDGVMLGIKGAAYHLEFTRRAGHIAGRAPTEDNLLVFYLPDEAGWKAAIERMEKAGYSPVKAFNPYWDTNGTTFEDPDGYRVVLQNDAWFGGTIERTLPVAYDIRLEQESGRPLAVVRRRASSQQLSKVVPEACGTVWSVVRSQQIAGAGRNVAVYLDGQINLEVGVEVETPFAGHGEVVASTTPAGLVATTTHYGPYGELHKAHEAIRQWCASNGHIGSGPNWEIYGHWKDEWNTDPSKICTDVSYLLQ